jgi:hypothetical protein
VALAAIRATTHVDGKLTRSSRRARRGAGYWSRTTIGASGRTPISSSPSAWRRASAARPPLTVRACPDGRPGGGGVRSATLRTIESRPWPPVCARFRPRLRRRHSPGPLDRWSTTSRSPRSGVLTTDGDGSVPHLTGPLPAMRATTHVEGKPCARTLSPRCLQDAFELAIRLVEHRPERGGDT